MNIKISCVAVMAKFYLNMEQYRVIRKEGTSVPLLTFFIDEQ